MNDEMDQSMRIVNARKEAAEAKGDISDTILFHGEPGGKFHFKKLSEIPQRDLEWLIQQKWCSENERAKIKEYLSVPPLTRALRKVSQ